MAVKGLRAVVMINHYQTLIKVMSMFDTHVQLSHEHI